MHSINQSELFQVWEISNFLWKIGLSPPCFATKHFPHLQMETQCGQVSCPITLELTRLYESLRVTNLSWFAWDFPGFNHESPAY